MPPTPRPSRRRPACRPPRWGLRISLATAGTVLAVSGFGHVVMTGVVDGIGRVDPFDDLTDRPEAGKGLNFLVVGVDGRDKISEKQRRAYHLGGAPCRCTDTMMLVHLSEDRDRASVISLPRDSYTTLPPHTDREGDVRHGALPSKLNAAYTHGGPRLTVETVERMTGVHVHHYLEVDFTSFMRTVDAVGGVPVCTVKPLKDSHSGLDLPAGTSVLGGGEALQYVRARHVDGSADLGRMERQQRFVASLIDQATRGGVLMNPGRLRKVTDAALSSVRADHGFGSEEMLALGRAMRGLGPASSEFATVPIANARHRVPELGETVLWDEVKAKKLFTALRRDEPLAERAPAEVGEGGKDGGDGAGGTDERDGEPPERAVPVAVPPRNIRVQVDNGTEEAGLGHRADRELAATGFATTGIPGNAKKQDAEKTEIAYDPRWDRSARSLAAALPGAELREVEGQGPLMRVTLGKDFRDVTPVRAAEPRPDREAERRRGYTVVTGDQVVCPD
ncbi:LCP family protein [Streptomyces sp. JJ38]|uniref:LCP family protein n=1 Tax=Streptomyces sp. JJ38 TaxID=2738128 RepID=UPI001C573B6D|nr:LCP family protein [Streptomyces sp. JJ38]